MKLRFVVEEAGTRNILSRDLDVLEPTFTKVLSGPCNVEFTLKYGSTDIIFKPYGQIIHVEVELQFSTGSVKILLGSGIVQPGEAPDETGALKITATGFSDYPSGIPWLQNWNPVTVDPFAIVKKIWDHLQAQPQGNLNVEIYPLSSGTYLVPGFSFDGLELIIEFFAIFIREADLRDCGEEINRWARDIPFDYFEQSTWNAGRTQIDKKIQLAYPRGGVQRNNIVFRQGENILQTQPTVEAQIDWVSEVRVRGWWPGKLYPGFFTNGDSKRFRRVLMEDDVSLNSRERSAVRAKRKLTKRQIPPHFSAIVIDGYHPNAPFGSWDLGDDILVQGRIPWVPGEKVAEWHRIMSYTLTPGGQVTLQLQHKDAFNYDPIDFEG